MRLIEIKKIERAERFVECATTILDKLLDHLARHPGQNLTTHDGKKQSDSIDQIWRDLTELRLELKAKASYFRVMAIDQARTKIPNNSS